MSFTFHQCEVHIHNPVNDSRPIGDGARWVVSRHRNSHNTTDSNIADSFNNGPPIRHNPFIDGDIDEIDAVNEATNNGGYFQSDDPGYAEALGEPTTPNEEGTGAIEGPVYRATNPFRHPYQPTPLSPVPTPFQPDIHARLFLAPLDISDSPFLSHETAWKTYPAFKSNNPFRFPQAECVDSEKGSVEPPPPPYASHCDPVKVRPVHNMLPFDDKVVHKASSASGLGAAIFLSRITAKMFRFFLPGGVVSFFKDWE